MDYPKIDPSQIPPLELRLLCATILDAVLRFYSNPENEARFQEWLQEKNMNDKT